MHAGNTNIEEFLGTPRTAFVVPVYQRNYEWTDNNCKQLFNDIINVIKNKKEHFLGTICFKNHNIHERLIIDGQQRLTSIMLIVKALYDLADDEEMKEDIKSSFLYNRGHNISDTSFLRIKLHLNKRDNQVYQILLNNDANTIDEILSVRQKMSRIYINYSNFKNYICQHANTGGSMNDILDTLRQLTIVELEIEKENPQEIFESFNSTGLDLSKVDLLRNYFLMQFSYDEQNELYNDYWQKIEDLVGPSNMTSFFVDYLIYKKKSANIMIHGKKSQINPIHLYEAYKDYYTSQECQLNFNNTKHFFTDMLDAAILYKHLIFNEYDEDIISNTLSEKIYELIILNDSKNSRCIILYLYELYTNNKITENTFIECLNALISYVFRSKICQTNTISLQIAGTVLQKLSKSNKNSINENFTRCFWKSITSGYGKYAFPIDADFKESLLNIDMYTILRSHGSKYFLYKLEQHSPYPKGLPTYNDATVTVEHIMPQKMTDIWLSTLPEKDKERYKATLHNIGNLALTNYKQEMSNKTFFAKQDWYAQSNFYYTKILHDASKWNVDAIIKRSYELTKAALKIWSYPSEYQQTQISHNDIYTLDSDYSKFAYTKPKVLLFGNEEYEVTAWSELLPVICKKLYKENESAFINIVKTENRFFIDDDSDNCDYNDDNLYRPVCDHIYIARGKSIIQILRDISSLLKKYDNVCETNWHDELLFTIK